ncbi:interferon-inducible GTPase 5-like [Parambassis ranga]|uniref:Interferon-inducible GTPase 5-like n=1 Tax=Parambassis ranga TaxID=210632 RepID=A0A6P7HGG6_9TELE|nr:interferon-inducible GTPase 5-like [Parambassis ranga]
MSQSETTVSNQTNPPVWKGSKAEIKISRFIMDADLDPEIKEALQNSDQILAVEMIKKLLDKQNNTPVNIAVTGESGSGKSSFVNAFRGLDNRDEGAAPTGCVETTREVTEYPHPNYPNVTLWDLPGIGTTKFPADKYLEHVGLEKFDFFIIVSATRFRENDVKLAQEIQKMGKRFYFVRSKIDSDLQNEERSQREFDREKTLIKIRENCIQGLQKEGFESPQVFLVSSFQLHEFDFSLLQETLERELPEHKRKALLFATPIVNLRVIEKKKTAFMSQIKYYAAASAAGAAVLVPGLSLAVDAGILVDAITQYVFGFGLDVSTMKKLAARSGVPYDDLVKVVHSRLSAKQITKDLVLKVLASLAGTTALLAIEEGTRFIPLVGIPIAMGLSSFTTYRALQFFLNELAEDAERVFKRVTSE